MTVKLWEDVWPSTTLPKLKLVGETANPGCTPVPLIGIVKGDPGALLVTVIDPEAFPAVVGANVTDNVAWLEAFSVRGVATPVTVNPVPVAATAEI